MAPHVANFLLGSFGIVAAVLLIGGSTFLRAQRARQRYELMRRAIDTGTPLPPAMPLWLASRRQALSILAVGVGLVLVGLVAWRVGARTPLPTRADGTTITATPPDAPPPPAFGRPPAPPAPDPAVEAWHAAQARVAVGQTAAGCGVILTLLGVIRLLHSNTERQVEERSPAARPVDGPPAGGPTV